MAADAEGAHIWDIKNPLQQDLVNFSLRYQELLNVNRPALTTDVDPELIWSHLRALKAIQSYQEEEIKCNGTATRTQQMESLLDHLQRGPAWRLHAFFRACVLTDQADIVSLVGLQPEDYTLPGDPPPGSSRRNALCLRLGIGLGCIIAVAVVLIGIGIQSATKVYQISGHVEISWTGPRPMEGHHYIAIANEENNLTSAIEIHRHNYESRIMTGVVFDIDDEDPDAKVTDLAKMYIETDLQMTDEYGFNKRTIPLKDIFKNFRGQHELNVVKISGHAGTGKTTYLKHLAHSWSQGKLDWKVVIYVKPTSMTADIWKTIHSNLWCIDRLKDAIIEYIQDDGEGTLVMFDALDEVHDEKIMRNLQMFIDEQNNRRWPKVLVAARPDFSQLKATSFQRLLDLPGFSIKQGLDYVSQHHHTIPTKETWNIVGYVTKNQQRLEPILSNPLHLHILVMLSTQGIIDLKSHHHVNTSMLLGSLENFLIMRQCAKQGNKEHLSLDRTTHARAFYRLCLYGMLTKQVLLTDELMNLFGIEPYSPYYVFLQKITTRDMSARKIVQYSFPHMMIYEYFASRGLLEASSDLHMPTLLLLTSQPRLCNLFITALTMATNVRTDIAQDLINAHLAQFISSDSKTLFVESSLLTKLSDAYILTLFINSSITVQQKDIVSNIWLIIEEIIYGCNDIGLEKFGIIRRIRHTLRYHPQQSQYLIYNRTISRLLPTGRVPGETLYAVGDTQVAAVNEDHLKHYLTIYARCPKDAHQALQQHKKRYHKVARSKVESKRVNLLISYGEESVFSGQCPEGLLKGSDWEKLFSYTLDFVNTKVLVIWVSNHTSIKELLDSAHHTCMKKPLSNHSDAIVRPKAIIIYQGMIRLADLINWWNKVKDSQTTHWILQLRDITVVVPNVMPMGLLSVNKLLQEIYETSKNEMINPRWITESGEVYIWDISDIHV